MICNYGSETDTKADLSCQYDLTSTIWQLGSEESIWLDATISSRIGAPRQLELILGEVEISIRARRDCERSILHQEALFEA